MPKFHTDTPLPPIHLLANSILLSLHRGTMAKGLSWLWPTYNISSLCPSGHIISLLNLMALAASKSFGPSISWRAPGRRLCGVSGTVWCGGSTFQMCWLMFRAGLRV